MIRIIYIYICLLGISSCTYNNDDITVTLPPEEEEQVSPDGYFTYTTYEASILIIEKYNELYPDDQIRSIIPAPIEEVYKAYAEAGVDIDTNIPSYLYAKAKPIDEIVADLEAKGVDMNTIEGYYVQPIDELAFFNLGYDSNFGGTINLLNAIGDLNEVKRIPYVGLDKFIVDTYELCGIIDKPGVYSTETLVTGEFVPGDNFSLSSGYIDAAISESQSAEDFAVDIEPFSTPIPSGNYQLNRHFNISDMMVSWLDLKAMDSESKTTTFKVCHNFYDGRVFTMSYSGEYIYVQEYADTDRDGISDDYEISISCEEEKVTFFDTDDDGILDMNDDDDDGDGIPTSDENADPNGDGNPSDAIDSDGDGTPDYLDADN